MTQIGARVVATRVAVAFGIDGRLIECEAWGFDGDFAKVREKRAISGVSRRHDAVKHVDSSRDSLDDVHRRAYAHEVAGSISREQGGGEFECLIHLCVWFAHSQPAYGKSIKFAKICKIPRGERAKFPICATLNNREEMICARLPILLFALVIAQGLLRPARRAFD